MLNFLARNWWVFLLRGLFAVAFGAIALLWPGVALGALILLFAIYAIADGVFALVGLMAGERLTAWWAQLLMGLLSLAAGVIALVWPDVTAVVLLIIVASWAIANGGSASSWPFASGRSWRTSGCSSSARYCLWCSASCWC